MQCSQKTTLKLFRQKCEYSFEGPFDGEEQKKTGYHLLLWVADKSLEMYNTTTWTNTDDKNTCRLCFLYESLP